jgi:hypothetical protein
MFAKSNPLLGNALISRDGLCTNKRSVRGLFVQLELLHKKSFNSIDAG